MDETPDDIAFHIIQTLEMVKEKLESLKAGAAPSTISAGNGFDARQLAIAITELEGSQLRVANARPD